MSSLEIFDKFIQERELLNDWKGFLSRDKRMLSRAKILKRCGIKRSALYQNRQIVDRLRTLESKLTEIGVLRADAVLLDREDQEAALNELSIALDLLENSVTQLVDNISGVQEALHRYSLPGST